MTEVWAAAPTGPRPGTSPPTAAYTPQLPRSLLVTQPVHQLVYVSATVRPLRRADLAQILRASRRRNPPLGITGVLAYADRAVLQALEGPAAAVEATFRHAAAAPRHHGVLVLYRAEAEGRTFPDYAMGLYRAADLSDDGRPGDGRPGDGRPGDGRDHARSVFDLVAAAAADGAPSRVGRFLGSFASLARPFD